MDYNGRTFRDEKVVVDGNTYRDCTFDRCVFEYDGGPLEMVGCHFMGSINWSLGGDLGRGMGAMRTFAHQGGPRHVKAIADFFANFIRRKDKPSTFEIR